MILMMKKIAFPHKLLLTNKQVSKLCKVFANGSSAKIKLSKTQFHDIGQSAGFLGRLSGPLLKTGLLLIWNVLKPLAKSILTPLGLTAATSATDAATHKKTFWSGTRLSNLANRTTLIIYNEEMNDIMKIVKSFEEPGLLIKGVNETIKNAANADLLTSKGTIRAGKGTIRASQATIRGCKGNFRAGLSFWCHLIP